MIHDLARDILDELCAGIDTIQIGPTAARLTSRLGELAECGDLDAQNVLDGLLRAGATKRVRDYAKKERVAPAVTPDGRVVSLSIRGGVPRRKSDTGERVVYFEQTLFEAMTWAEFHDYVGGLIQQVRTLTDQIRVLERFRDLQQRFPESWGPGDAAKQAGTSLEEVLAEVQEAS